MNGRQRSFIAIATAATLTAVGIAAVASASAPPPAVPAAAAAPQTAELSRSVDTLLAQVSGLEAAIAAPPVPAAVAPVADPSAASSPAVIPASVREPAPSAAVVAEGAPAAAEVAAPAIREHEGAPDDGAALEASRGGDDD